MQADYVLNYDVISAASDHQLNVMARIKGHPAQDIGKRPPLNLCLVMDRSGSMQGDKLAFAKEAAKFLVRNLGTSDRFSLVTYDTEVEVNINPTPIIHKDPINQAIARIHAGSSTNLSGGWLQGCNLVAEVDKNRLVEHTEPELTEKQIIKGQVNRVLLLTDGLANQGISDPGRLAAMARQKYEEGVPTTTMGVGMDFNEDLLTRMATEGGGSFYFIDNADKIPEIFARELQSLLEVVGQNLTITLMPSADVQFVRQLNAYPSTTSPDITFRLGDLYGDEVKSLLIELHIPRLKTLGEVEIARLRFDYDELEKERITHRRLELPIMVNVVAAEAYDIQKPNPEVVKTVLLLQAAETRKKAIEHADAGNYEAAAQCLSEMADTIETANEDDKDLQNEHNMLREEAVDMELGAKRYDAHTRKVSTSQLFDGQTRPLYGLDNTMSLRERLKQSRDAIERNGKTPTHIRWDQESRRLDNLRIGRNKDNDIVISEHSVSKYHCQIVREGDDFFLEDLNSTNGTFANSGRVQQRFRLSVGDVVTVGACLFRFEELPIEAEKSPIPPTKTINEVDKSWQMAGGPGSRWYEFYDWLRRGLNQRITSRLVQLGMTESGMVIEAGSGTGFATTLLAEHAAVTLSIAVDYDLEALAEGRKTNPQLCGVAADVHHLPFKRESVQLVWNSSTIEHLDDQAAVTREMARLVRPGGAVFVGVPYKWGPLFFQKWIPHTPVGIWLGTVYGRRDVESWLHQAGCTPVASWRYFFWFFIGVIGRKPIHP